MKYFIHNGADQQGPYSLEDLKTQNIRKDTFVWYEGLEDWREAYTIDEIKHLIGVSVTPPPLKRNVPPPLGPDSIDANKHTNPTSVNYISEFSASETDGSSTSLYKAFLITLLICVSLSGIAYIFYMNSGGTNSVDYTAASLLPRQKTPAELRAELKSKELTAPLDYLRVDYSTHENLIGEAVVKGNIVNSATLATFKDVLITVQYYSGTNSYLGQDEQRIYEYVTPGGSVEFKLKHFMPRDCERVDVSIGRAKPVYE